MANFKIGDVVRLKSGGPEMTVVSVIEAEKGGLDSVVLTQKYPDSSIFYRCEWFVGTKLSIDSFPENSLNSVEDEEMLVMK